MASIGSLVAYLNADLTGLDSGLKSASGKLKKYDKRVDQTATSSNKSFQKMTKGINSLKGALGGLALVAIANDIKNVALQFEAMEGKMAAGTGSIAGASREMTFMREESKRLGLSLVKTGNDYGQMLAAAKGTKLQGQGIRDVFTSVAEASTVLRLSSDDTSGAIRALNQMISKGTVQAEELRGQLGERVPGAFNIAARAMGVTTQELGKMLEQGEVVSDEFLPKFAKELRKTFADQLPSAVNSAQARLNRFGNTMAELKNRIAKSGLFELFLQGLDFVAKAIPALEFMFIRFVASANVVGIKLRDYLQRIWTRISADFERLWVGAKKVLSIFVAGAMRTLAGFVEMVGKAVSFIPGEAAKASAAAAATSAANLRAQAGALTDFGDAFAAITAKEQAAYAAIKGDTDILLAYVNNGVAAAAERLAGDGGPSSALPGGADTGDTGTPVDLVALQEANAKKYAAEIEAGQKMKDLWLTQANERGDIMRRGLDAEIQAEEAAKAQKQKLWTDTLGSFSALTGAMASIAGSGNKKMEKINQAFALAEAIRNMWVGVSAGVALGWPMAVPAVAYALATGVKAIAGIKSGSGGGGSAGGASIGSSALNAGSTVDTGIQSRASQEEQRGLQDVKIEIKAEGDIVDLDAWMANKGAPAIKKLLNMGTDFGINPDVVVS